MALDGTYAGLQASVADWLNRADLSAAIPDFITLAEAQISRRLVMDGPVRRMMARSDAAITSEFAAVPADFMGARTIYLIEDRVTALEYCLPEEINRKKGRSDLASGSPRFFAVVGGEFQFFPAPGDGASFAAELTYWQRLPALAGAGGNWLLSCHPDAYLYGALLQAAPYLKDDGRVPMWEAAFETVLSDIVAADKIERDSTLLAVPHADGGLTP